VVWRGAAPLTIHWLPFNIYPLKHLLGPLNIWCPLSFVHAQVWRDGQKKRVFVYRFLATGTIEEKVCARARACVCVCVCWARRSLVAGCRCTLQL